MPSRSRVNKDMWLRVDYNIVGEHDVPQAKSQNQTPRSAGSSKIQDQSYKDKASQVERKTATAGASSTMATLPPEPEAFPELAPAKNPLAPFPTNPEPFEGIPLNTLRHLPAQSSVKVSAFQTIPEHLPAPPKEPLCTSAFCPIDAAHVSKPFTASDLDRPYYVKELEECLQKGYDRGLDVAKWKENDFLDVFYSVHWAWGPTVGRRPQGVNKNGKGKGEEDALEVEGCGQVQERSAG